MRRSDVFYIDGKQRRSDATLIASGTRINLLTFIEEIEAYRYPSGQLERRALFSCFCGGKITGGIHKWKYGELKSCGCWKFTNYSRPHRPPRPRKSTNRPPARKKSHIMKEWRELRVDQIVKGDIIGVDATEVRAITYNGNDVELKLEGKRPFKGSKDDIIPVYRHHS